MKIILSRKGFDSAAGGAPSPVLDGVPMSLPIPTTRRSETTYRSMGLGEVVERVTRRKIGADHLCHEDPMFSGGRWAFGQTGRAESHLARHRIEPGDVFLFFGLFRRLGGGDRHHRIFGWMEVGEVKRLGAHPTAADDPTGFPRRHPHSIGDWEDNNTLYLGVGGRAATASDELRLSKPGASPSIWRVPTWMKSTGLSYHADPTRWAMDGELRTVARGQEFIADVGDLAEPRRWLQSICETISRGG